MCVCARTRVCVCVCLLLGIKKAIERETKRNRYLMVDTENGELNVLQYFRTYYFVSPISFD